MKHKPKVYLSKMNTPIGTIPVVSNFQTFNRDLTLYSAQDLKGSSIFFIVRDKDVKALKNIGWHIQSILVPKGKSCLLAAKFKDGNFNNIPELQLSSY